MSKTVIIFYLFQLIVYERWRKLAKEKRIQLFLLPGIPLYQQERKGRWLFGRGLQEWSAVYSRILEPDFGSV
jgi:hypothetical protein